MDIEEGHIVALVGPSGCGKTTTLKMINRLVEPTAGSINVFGQDQKTLPAYELRRQIGYVIQQVGLFPHRTIEANIGAVPKLLGWDSSRIRSRIEELVQLVGLLPEILHRYRRELSGGQQQRIGVARALAADPPLLLMDEPYSAVDPIVRSRLQDELLDLQQKVNKTIVVVTHDIDEAVKLGDKIAVFRQGGVLEQYTTAKDLLRNPASEFVEQFLGEDRGLRQLGLFTVGDIDYLKWPSIQLGDSYQTAEAEIDTASNNFCVVLGGSPVVGWTDLLTLAGRPANNSSVHPFEASVTPETTLRTALDRIVQSASKSAVVCDDEGNYLGLVTIDELSLGLEKV